MARATVPLLLGVCLLILMIGCFGGVLFRGEQFAFRDAGHFYYPLYQQVQKEWAAGRWPLWDSGENSGMPLLGNPSAAVLYPGKAIFAVAPSYAWGMRLYVLSHLALAVAGMYALGRSWGLSQAGSALSGLSYGFSAPVMFQYCNVIFLVGAAWAPLALRGADRWLRLGRRSGLIELTVALAMQATGGDPQSAYLCVLCAGGFLLILSRKRMEPSPSSRTWKAAATMTIGLIAWVAITLAVAIWLPPAR